MAQQTRDVVGVGHAIVDVLAQVDEPLLLGAGRRRGGSSLDPAEQFGEARQDDDDNGDAGEIGTIRVLDDN